MGCAIRILRTLPLFLTPSLPLHLPGGVSAATGLQDSLSAVNSTGAELTASLSNLTATANAVLGNQTYCPVVAPPPFCATLTQLVAETGTAQAATTAAMADAASLTDTFNGVLNNPNFQLEDLGQHVWLWSIIGVSSFGAWLVLASFAACKTRGGAAYLRWACSLLMVLAFILVWLFAAVFMAGALVGSDFCVAPATSVSSLVGNATDAYTQLSWYINCNATTQGGLPGEINNGLTSLSTAIVQTNDLISTNTDPALNDTLLIILADLTSSSASLTSLGGEVDCESIGGAYTQMVNSVCTTGIPSVIVVWGLATLAAVFGFFLTCSGARLCWRHPGDPVSDESFPAYATPQAVYLSNASSSPKSGAAAPRRD